MSQVSATIGRQIEKCAKEIRKELEETATQSIFYVALGKVLRRDLAEKYGLTEDMVGDLLSANACSLVDEIRKLN